VTAILLQSVTSVITKCDTYYKVRQFYYKVRQVLQSAMIITKCDRTGRSVLGKTVPSVLRTARGRTQDLGHSFFSNTDLPPGE